MVRRGLWLRWSWRDLRNHWVAVIAIGLVLAIGIGIYAGLGATSTWRRQSNDASFAAVNMHDLRATLSPGTFVDEGVLEATVRSIGGPGQIGNVNERLVVDNQVDASTDDETILAGARVVGMSFGDQTVVDDVWVRNGAAPEPAAPAAVLEAKFADYYDLPAQGTVSVAGGATVAYVGLGVAPEEYYVVGSGGSIFAEADLATLYLPLDAAQELVGRPRQVNDVVLTIDPTADRQALEADLREAMAAIPGLSVTVTNRDDADAFRLLYEDIDNDQQIWNGVSALVLLAASLAAFNLVSRIVEAQRREIGIGMALGVARWKLAMRPLLVGAQVAVLGTLAGIGVGVLVGRAMEGLLESFLPLPEYRTSFQFGLYAQAALLGLVIPIVASVLPVWRALRVEPIEAIRTGHLTARAGRLTDWTSRVRLPGSSLTQMPMRNVLRTPRRTLLTAIGIGAAITALVAVMGMLDSFSRTVDRGGDEVTKADPERVVIGLDTFYPTDSPVVTAVAAEPEVGATDAAVRLPAVALTPDLDDEFDLIVELLDFETAGWTPTMVETAGSPEAGLVIARKAARDLGVEPGETVTVRLPARRPDGGFALTEASWPVSGIHPNPLRTLVYGDIGLAAELGLDGLTNTLHAFPADGSARLDVQQSVFDLDGVTSTQAVARVSELFDEALEQFVGFLFITAAAVLALALLIAFNASRITIDERRREHATMRAFGIPVRSVMGVVTKESVLVGLAATAIGIAAGTLFLDWMLRSLATRSLPDFGIELYLSPRTLILAVVVGVVAVAVAPLFLVRRVRRMNLPDTLRVME